jgi:hypothetical protein
MITFLFLYWIKCSGLGEDRTRDLLIMSQLLLTAELQGQLEVRLKQRLHPYL